MMMMLTVCCADKRLLKTVPSLLFIIAFYTRIFHFYLGNMLEHVESSDVNVCAYVYGIGEYLCYKLLLI